MEPIRLPALFSRTDASAGGQNHFPVPLLNSISPTWSRGFKPRCDADGSHVQVGFPNRCGGRHDRGAAPAVTAVDKNQDTPLPQLKTLVLPSDRPPAPRADCAADAASARQKQSVLRALPPAPAALMNAKCWRIATLCHSGAMSSPRAVAVKNQTEIATNDSPRWWISGPARGNCRPVPRANQTVRPHVNPSTVAWLAAETSCESSSRPGCATARLDPPRAANPGAIPPA